MFVLDGVADTPGFVRTSGALTVARVHAWTSASGDVSAEILAVEAIVWRMPTKGPIPPDAVPPEGGDMNGDLVPDFVSAWDRDGRTIAGYVPKRYLLEGFDIAPGSPSDPPQPAPQPVYGEDLTTLVGHMVPEVGFVALGSSATSPGPTVSVMPASAGPSLAPTPPADGVDCGRIARAACMQAIALARDETEVKGASLIVVDDTCPPPSVCDRQYPFDSIVVFAVTGDTTSWHAIPRLRAAARCPDYGGALVVGRVPGSRRAADPGAAANALSPGPSM